MSDATPPKPVSIPPSAGGTIAATIAGIMIGRSTSMVIQGDVAPLAGDWLLPLGLIAFVFVVVNGTQKLRTKLGVQATPDSIRRQWMVVGGGAAIGLVLGFFGAHFLGLN